MRHRDGVYYVPLELNEYGFRNGYFNESNQTNIAFLGGRSMIFGYGVSEENTIPHLVSSKNKQYINTYNIALPGFDIYRSFNLYIDNLADYKKMDIAVITIYGAEALGYYNHDESKPLSFYCFRDFFKYSNDVVLRPGKLGDRLGKYYSVSYLLKTIVDIIDKLGLILYQNNSTKDLSELSLKNFAALISKIDTYFSKKGTKVIFITLPIQGEKKVFYNYLSPIMQSYSFFDLHKEVDINENNWIARGHYNSRANKIIANSIASKLKDQLIKK